MPKVIKPIFLYNLMLFINLTAVSADSENSIELVILQDESLAIDKEKNFASHKIRRLANNKKEAFFHLVNKMIVWSVMRYGSSYQIREVVRLKNQDNILPKEWRDGFKVPTEKRNTRK